MDKADLHSRISLVADEIFANVKFPDMVCCSSLGIDSFFKFLLTKIWPATRVVNS